MSNFKLLLLIQTKMRKNLMLVMRGLPKGKGQSGRGIFAQWVDITVAESYAYFCYSHLHIWDLPKKPISQSLNTKMG